MAASDWLSIKVKGKQTHGAYPWAGVDPIVVMGALRPIDFQTLKVSEGRVTGDSGEASFLLAYVMSFMLYFALLLYGIQVMSSVVEEKSSRIMEVLVSSLTPFQMLLGKVVGVCRKVA